MTQYFYGDPEITLKDLSQDDLGLRGLEEKIKKRGEYKGFFGKLKRKIQNFINPAVVYIPGDFMGHDTYLQLQEKTNEIYEKIISGNEDYKDFIKLSGDSKKDLRAVFNRLCWDDSIHVGGEVDGFYKKVFSRLHELSYKYNVKVAFVLGNHDQRHSDFNPSFENAKKINGWRNLYFVDQKVEKIGGLFGYVVGGVGGSEELMGDLGLTNAEECAELGFAAHEAFLKNLEESRYTDLSTLLFHKFYDKPEAEFLYGNKPRNVMHHGSMVKFNERLVKKLDEEGLLCSSGILSSRLMIASGHWHGGGLFNWRDNITVVNPGKKACLTKQSPFNQFGKRKGIKAPDGSKIINYNKKGRVINLNRKDSKIHVSTS